VKNRMLEMRYINFLKSFLNQGHQRTLLAKKNILISFFIKAFGMIVVFTMISVSIKYLGKEKYGIWIVLSGLVAWSNVFNLGFSHGLRNRLAEAKAKDDLEIGKYYVSTTYAFLIFVAIILSAIFIPLFSYLDWQGILNTITLDNETIRYTILIIFSFFILQFILKPIGSILEAFQWPAISQFISLLGSALALLGVFYLLFIKKFTSLPLYAYFVAGSPFVVFLLASIYFYKQKFLDLMPSTKYVKRKYFNKIAGLGISFFIIQLSVLVIFQSDNMIISYLFGPEEVTNYNIAYRYFSIITIIFGVIMAPFWTAFTDAYQKNDFVWIQKTMRILLLMTGGSAFGAILLYLISNDVYNVWIDENIDISNILSALMAFYAVLFSFHTVVAFFSNGIGKVKIQLWSGVVAALLNLPLSYYFGKILGFGTSGVLLATIICMMFVDILLFLQYKKIIEKKAVGIWNQ